MVAGLLLQGGNDAGGDGGGGIGIDACMDLASGGGEGRRGGYGRHLGHGVCVGYFFAGDCCLLLCLLYFGVQNSLVWREIARFGGRLMTRLYFFHVAKIWREIVDSTKSY